MSSLCIYFIILLSGYHTLWLTMTVPESPKRRKNKQNKKILLCAGRHNVKSV